MKIEVIKYNQEWDFHNRFRVLIMNEGKVAASACLCEYEQDIVIEEVYVQPEYRNKGVGSILMAELQQMGLMYTEISLKVKRDNKYAIKLYEKWGFEAYRIEEPGIYEWMKFRNQEKI